jgi:hypothetical protein
MADDEKVLYIDAPLRNTKDIWLNLFYQLYNSLGSAIVDIKGKTDMRIKLLSQLIISTIPDEEEQKRIREELEKSIKEIESNGYSNEVKGEKIQEACLKVLGEVTLFLDESIGVSKRLAIGEI